MKLVLGTMTFGESVFAPNVGEFVEMFLDAGYEELAKKIMQFDEVSDLCLMSGSYDFLVTVKADDLQSAAMFVSHRLAPIEGVTSTATHFMLRNYKQMGVRICYDNKDDRRIMSF